MRKASREVIYNRIQNKLIKKKKPKKWEVEEQEIINNMRGKTIINSKIDNVLIARMIGDQLVSIQDNSKMRVKIDLSKMLFILNLIMSSKKINKINKRNSF